MDKYQKIDHDWKEKMFEIGRAETTYFEKDNLLYTEDMIRGNCRRHIMTWVYSTLKAAKKISPIEMLELDVKQQMWEFVKEICAGKTEDKLRMIEIAKVFYVIEYFIKEKE